MKELLLWHWAGIVFASPILSVIYLKQIFGWKIDLDRGRWYNFCLDIIVCQLFHSVEVCLIIPIHSYLYSFLSHLMQLVSISWLNLDLSLQPHPLPSLPPRVDLQEFPKLSDLHIPFPLPLSYGYHDNYTQVFLIWPMNPSNAHLWLNHMSFFNIPQQFIHFPNMAPTKLVIIDFFSLFPQKSF